MLTLHYKGNTSVPVEVDGITPSAVLGQALAEVERMAIHHGNRTLHLADLFDVSGETGDGRIEFVGNLAAVHWIGAHMTEGQVFVRGSAGRHVGSEMAGGEIHVDGDASDWVGGEMHGGLIHVRGNTGDLVGSAYRGSKRGMTGGTILVHGSAGHEVGQRLRRGVIAIGGSCGDFIGSNMIAGTVLAFGECGIRPAANLRRGTVGLLGDNPPALLGTFRRGCLSRPLVLQLLFRRLQSFGFVVPEVCVAARYRTYHGDYVTIGRGEVWVREGAAQP